MNTDLRKLLLIINYNTREHGSGKVVVKKGVEDSRGRDKIRFLVVRLTTNVFC